MRTFSSISKGGQDGQRRQQRRQQHHGQADAVDADVEAGADGREPGQQRLELDAGVHAVVVEPHDQHQHQRHQAEQQRQPAGGVLGVVGQGEDDQRCRQREEDGQDE
ncbi:MAG: hypothetical protein IPH95_14440 [Candidatus Promineofilum sp.]|nr:hypothetical protein [Promineifilum sp.]